MHVDHLTFAAGPSGLKAEAERLGGLLGAKFRNGGSHPRFGTRNRILALADDRYIEVIEVLEHPAAEKAPFGQAVRARSALGGGWMGWAVSVDDLGPFEQRLARAAVPASRVFPDGRTLEWHQIGVKGLLSDPQLPFFTHWDSDESLRPGALGGSIKLVGIELVGSRERVEEWVGAEIGAVFDGVRLEFTSQHGQPGIAAAIFESDTLGTIRI